MGWGKTSLPEDALAQDRRHERLGIGDEVDLDLIEKGQIFLKYSGLRSYFHSDVVGGSLSRNGPVPITLVFKAFTGSGSTMCLGMMMFQPLAKSGKQEPRRPLAVNHHRIRVGRLDALDEGREHRAARAHHALGWVHDALNSVLDIGGRKGGAIVPLHPLVEVEGERFATVAHLPGIGQLGMISWPMGS